MKGSTYMRVCVYVALKLIKFLSDIALLMEEEVA